MKKKEIKEYPIESSPLYKLSNKRKLEEMLGLKKYVLNKEKVSKRISYFNFETDKKDGSKRDITAPVEYLKSIQRSLYNLLSRIEKPNWLISGRKGKCYIDNAKLHQNNNSKYALTMDIKKFYPNCNKKYVSRFFHKDMKMSSDLANLLTELLTHSDEIPTGSPASQLLAFLVYRKMFEELNILALKYKCVFSVFVDDLAFSSVKPFNRKSLENAVGVILKKYGHSIKRNKTCYYGKNDNKLFTGAILNSENKIKIPNNLHYKINNDKDNILNNKNLSDTDKSNLRNSLKGRIVSAKHLESNAYSELAKAINKKII